MTISTVGVAPGVAVNFKQFAQIMQDMGDLGRGDGIADGLVVSPGGGRSVNISAGRALISGCTLLSTASENRVLPAGAGIVIAAQITWSNTATSDNSGALVGVASAVSALTKNPGTLMQTPIAVIAAPASGGTITDAMITNLWINPPDGQGLRPRLVVSGLAYLSVDTAANSAPSSLKVTFPPGLFKYAPSVTMTPGTGASATVADPSPTVCNYWVNGVTKDSATLNMTRTTRTETLFYWEASGR